MTRGHPAPGVAGKTERGLDALDGDAKVTRGPGSVAAECQDGRKDLALALGQGFIRVVLDHEDDRLAGSTEADGRHQAGTRP